MTAPNTGPCTPWATIADLGGHCADLAGITDAERLEALDASSEILYSLSARQFPGICETTVRPYSAAQEDVIFDRVSRSYGESFGYPVSWMCGGSACAETHRSLYLTPGPVRQVSQVVIDGQVLDPSEYRVDDWRYLVRLEAADGTHLGWPCGQDMSKGSGEPGTFEVTYTYGRNPPVSGKRAAASLACELLLAKNPSTEGKCRLPKRVQSITRQGVTMTVVDPLDIFDRGKTGIPEVDLFLKAVNPHMLSQRSRAFSPDTLRKTRQPGTDAGS